MNRVLIFTLGMIFLMSQVSMAGSIEDKGKQIIIKPKSSYTNRLIERDDARAKLFDTSIERDEARQRSEDLAKRVAELESREPETLIIEKDAIKWDIVIFSFIMGFITHGMVGGK